MMLAYVDKRLTRLLCFIPTPTHTDEPTAHVLYMVYTCVRMCVCIWCVCVSMCVHSTHWSQFNKVLQIPLPLLIRLLIHVSSCGSCTHFIIQPVEVLYRYIRMQRACHITHIYNTRKVLLRPFKAPVLTYAATTTGRVVSVIWVSWVARPIACHGFHGLPAL